MISEAVRRYFNRSALRSVRERGSRIDRFKLTAADAIKLIHGASDRR